MKIFYTKIVRSILIFTTLFISCIAIYFDFEPLNKPVLAILYFSFFIISIYFWQKNIFQPLFLSIQKIGLIIFSVIIFFHVITFYICHKFGTSPIDVSQQYVSFLNLDLNFLFVKPFEVGFQQVLIVFLAYTLYSQKIKLRNILIIFVIFFGLLHCLLIQKLDIKIALYFIIFATLFAWIFPFLILKIRGGIWWSFAVHLFFYDFSAILFWFL